MIYNRRARNTAGTTQAGILFKHHKKTRNNDDSN